MLKSQVQIGGRYTAKVSNQLTTVKITGTNRYGGWNAVNEATKRDVRIKSAAKLRGPAEPVKPPVTNGNGDRLATEPQINLIENLLDEKVVSQEMVNHYQVATLEERFTISNADWFIKQLIRAPKKDGNNVPARKSTKHTAPAVNHVKLTTERIALIGNEAGVDMVNESFEGTDIIASTVQAILADITSPELVENMTTEALNNYTVAYLNGVRAGVEDQLTKLKSEFPRKRTTRR
jgi:hypothetical protein